MTTTASIIAAMSAPSRTVKAGLFVGHLVITDGRRLVAIENAVPAQLPHDVELLAPSNDRFVVELLSLPTDHVEDTATLPK